MNREVSIHTNPYIVEHVNFTKQQRDLKLASHNLIIEGVYQWNKPVREELFDIVRIFCAQYRIEFYLREFNSEAFEEDREYIIQLPAFHIFYKDEYEKTFYREDSVETIIEGILVNEQESKKKGKRKGLFQQMQLPNPFKWLPRIKRRTCASSTSSLENV